MGYLSTPQLPLCSRPLSLRWLALIGVAWLMLSAASVQAAPPTLVAVEANRVLRDDFLGVGVQWSSYSWWDVSDEDWSKVFRRIEFMRLPFARVMLDRGSVVVMTTTQSGTPMSIRTAQQ